jgi:ABC-type glutathione transport system ATPase component
VTHDINLAAEFADSVVLLKGGRMVAAGNPHAVLTEELLGEVLDIKVLVDAHPLSGAPRITPAHEARRYLRRGSLSPASATRVTVQGKAVKVRHCPRNCWRRRRSDTLWTLFTRNGKAVGAESQVRKPGRHLL